LARDASADDIRRAYKRAALRLHPDKNDSPEAHEQFKRLTGAYAVLQDPVRKALYDATGATEESELDGDGLDVAEVVTTFQHMWAESMGGVDTIKVSHGQPWLLCAAAPTAASFTANAAQWVAWRTLSLSA
jgi:DnaJ-class molecular chaperone